MYKLYVVDKENNKINIFESKSEAGMDNFTTHFDSKEDLLNQISLDTEIYKIQEERLLKDEDNGEEEIFITSKYKNVDGLYNNNSNERALIDYSSKEVETLREFFLNELLRFPLEKELNDYDKKRYSILDRIIYTYDTYDKGNDKDISSLYSNMRAYFYENYSSLKALYVYLVNRGKDVTKLISDSSRINFDEEIKRIKRLVQSKGISKNGIFIDESLPKKEIKYNISEDDDVENLLDNDMDSDTLHTELDMLLDSKKLTTEEKNKVKENNKNRL